MARVLHASCIPERDSHKLELKASAARVLAGHGVTSPRTYEPRDPWLLGAVFVARPPPELYRYRRYRIQLCSAWATHSDPPKGLEMLRQQLNE